MDLLNTLIIALVCVSIGFVVGLMISNLRRESESRAKSGPDIAPLPDLSYLPVTNFVRTTVQGPLILNMDGHYYRSSGELNPEQRAKMEELTIELHSWLGYPLPPAKPSAEVLPFREEDMEEALPAVIQTAPYAYPVDAANPAGKTGPLVFPAVLPAPTPRKAAALSIVQQIDGILQENMTGTEFMDRGIRLIELPNRGVAVQVGLDQYLIDEIPDSGIRGLIRAAVSEWELMAK